MTDDGVQQVTETQVLAAMTHPLRRRILDVLKVDGPSTVSALAGRLGQQPANVSHHLRVLRDGGLVEPAPELVRDRREAGGGWFRPVCAGPAAISRTRWWLRRPKCLISNTTPGWCAPGSRQTRSSVKPGVTGRSPQTSGYALPQTSSPSCHARLSVCSIVGRSEMYRTTGKPENPCSCSPSGYRHSMNRDFRLILGGETTSALNVRHRHRASAHCGGRSGRRCLRSGPDQRFGLAALASRRAAGRCLGRPPTPAPSSSHRQPALRPAPGLGAGRSLGRAPHPHAPPGSSLFTGAAGVFFQTAHQVFLSSAIAAPDLPKANAALQVGESVTQIAGPGVAGLLAQFAGAVLGLLLDAATFLVSSLCLLQVRAETARPTDPSRRRLRTEIAEAPVRNQRSLPARSYSWRRSQQSCSDRLSGHPGRLPGPRNRPRRRYGRAGPVGHECWWGGRGRLGRTIGDALRNGSRAAAQPLHHRSRRSAHPLDRIRIPTRLCHCRRSSGRGRGGCRT